MLKQPPNEKLAAMRLLGNWPRRLKAQEQDPSAREMSFLERFGLLVDQQWNWRENQALSRRLKNAKLRTANACVEEIDYRTARGLDKSMIRSLTQQPPGSGRTRTFSSLSRPAWARASWRALWRRRHVATGTLRSTLTPNRCFATWRWHEQTAACAAYSRDSAASMSSSSTTGPWLRYQNPSVATSGRSAKTATKCARRS